MKATGATLAMLLDRGELHPSGSPGIYVQGARFMQLVAAIDAVIMEAEPPGAFEDFATPPQMPGATATAHKYDMHFPELLAGVAPQTACGCGGKGHADPGEAMVLVPAVCHLLYPLLGRRAAKGRGVVGLYAMKGSVFRAEPSQQSKRWQSFSVREWVCVGHEERVETFAEAWRSRWTGLCDRFGLDGQIDAASDPFTGPTARIMRSRQRQTGEKLELNCPLDGLDCAISSINRHGPHFSDVWDLRAPDGRRAMSACVAFGLERTALAMIDRHGLESALTLAERDLEGAAR
ncbi:hypothetical protein [Roseobacter sp. MH60115]|uniref:hypothetical protein n=1 Tax=Roseobacter sp. MH60115 TaxID=2785324 RepID=UPI0018A27A0B|nr:hypothetical protein [Roseobacter sp. MH60115]